MMGWGELSTRYRKLVCPRVASDQGQTMAEYVVVLGVITLAIVTSFVTLSGSVESLLNQVAGLFP